MQQDKVIAEYSARATRAAALKTAPQDDLSIDLRAILHRLWRGKGTLAICLLIGGLLGALVALQMVPMYRASSKVMFSAPGGTIGALPQTGSGQGVNERTLLNEIEVLKSSRMIGRVVDKLSLMDSPRFNASLRPAQPGLVDRLPGGSAIVGALRDLGVLATPVPEPPAAPEETEQRIRSSVIREVARGYGFEPLPGTRIIRISYSSTNPALSARLVNTLADQYILEQLDAKLDATRTATTWLSERVAELRQRVQASEQAVEAARSEQSARSGQSLEITRQQLNALNGTLTVARNATTAARATYERLRDAVAEGRDFGAISEFRAASLIQSYRAREDELVSQRVNLLGSVPETHPTVQRIDMQLAEIRSNIRDEAASIVEAARLDWVAARDREESTAREVRSLEDLALIQSRAALEIRQLEREAEADRILYANFLARLNETSEQQKLQTADARVLTPADPPARPLSTKRTRVLVAGLLAGLLAGVALLFVSDRLNDTFRTPADLEDKTGLRVLGALPVAGRGMPRIEVLRRFRENPRASLSEAVRNLRTSMLFSNVDAPPRVILFTSSVPGEGKSTSSLLLAMTSRQMGKSAIIVDCDLRLPALAPMLGAENDDAPGLLSLIEGTATIDEAVHVDPETGLNVLMSKRREARATISAADILSSHRFEELIGQLRERYDMVILDAPPALVVTDARILSACSDAVVYVVRWDHTPRGAVLEGIAELGSVNAPVIGTVLALVDEKKASRQSYGGSAYYKGRYHDYYSA